jgi:hypothetical protein
VTDTNLSRRSLLKAGAALPVAAALPAAAVVIAEPVWAEATVAAPVAAAAGSAWGWWAGADCGERFSLGPFATREEAVDEGRRYWGGDTFDIIEAIQGEPNLRVSGNDLLEWLDERNEDHWDKDGDCTVFTSDISKEARRELGNVVSAAIAAWVERHNVSVKSFMFADTRNEDVIQEDRPTTSPQEAEAPTTQQGGK